MGHRGIITAERLTTVDENAVALIGLDARIQQMDQMLDRLLSDDDLAGPAVQALQIVEAAGRRGLRQCALADSVSLPAGTVSRLVDTLVKGDLVSRRPHPTDRRVTMLALTAAGGRRRHNRQLHLPDERDDWTVGGRITAGSPKPSRPRPPKPCGS